MLMIDDMLSNGFLYVLFNSLFINVFLYFFKGTTGHYICSLPKFYLFDYCLGQESPG